MVQVITTQGQTFQEWTKHLFIVIRGKMIEESVLHQMACKKSGASSAESWVITIQLGILLKLSTKTEVIVKLLMLSLE